MGDSQAVELAQTAHVGLLFQAGLLVPEALISMGMPIPRSPVMLGVIIDDLIVFERLLKGSTLDFPGLPSCALLDSAVGKYTEVGLLPHPGKTFHGMYQSEFWGSLFEGDRGFVRASLKRVVPVVFATLGVVKLGVCTISLLEVLVGCWNSIFLFRRRMLSLFNVCYEALQRAEDRRSVIRLSPELRTELLLFVNLAPVAATCIRTLDSPVLYASDASDWGWAACSAELPEVLRSEVHRHKLSKPVWAKLLSPLRAVQRLKGLLPPADELPSGLVLPTHPLFMDLASSLQFQVDKKAPVRRSTHINISELRSMVECERLAALRHFPSRIMSLSNSQVSLGCWIKGRSTSVGLNQELQQSLPVHLWCGMTSNGAYIPSELNPADDPTRHVAIRSPSKSLPSWIFDLIESHRGGGSCDWTSFDAWLDSYGFSSQALSGLPSFDELKAPWVEPPWNRTSRHKAFLRRSKAKCPLNSEPCSSLSAAVEFRESPNSCRVDFSKAPTASTLGRKPLSRTALEVLKRVPFGQFLLPKDWHVTDPLWRPDFPGYLDLYSGAKGVAKALCQSGVMWCITFDTADDVSQDLSLDSNRKLAEELVAEGCVLALGAAIFCCSFSRAVRPPVRSRMQPCGLPGISPSMQEKVAAGNSHSRWLASLVALCMACGVFFWVENPDGSFLWLQEEWLTLGANAYASCFRLDYCCCGTPWRKRTRFFTDLHLRGQSVFCSRLHKHVRLVGWSRLHKMSWTRAAQEYPRRLCRWISTCILIDTGNLPGRAKLDVNLVARQSPGRIGEADNPGPRRARSTPVRRDASTLAHTLLVEPSTELLGTKVWSQFKGWCLRDMCESDFEAFAAIPATLSELVEAFGLDLFSKGGSLYVLRHLITAIQRWNPQFRSQLGRCWQLVGRWESLEPVSHRVPLPLVIFRAMVSVAILWGWMRFAGIMVLTFGGICRPGEPLNAVRKDLLLPRDLVVENPDICYLCIRSPKGRRRGIGKVQHVKISERTYTKFLDKVFGKLASDQPLFFGTPGTFRRRWDAILSVLSVPAKLGLTPASMRAGGAVQSYRSDEEIAKILWKMRLKHLDTLQYYLQELGAVSAFLDLPSSSKLKVEKTAQLFSALLDLP